MTLNQFINTWNGNRVEATGNAIGSPGRDQCVDLAAKWAQNLGKKFLRGNAKDWAGYISGYKWIKNTPTGVPKAGDLIVWYASKSNGYYGHIAIFVSGGVWSFTSFDQNYPTGSVCHRQSHNYSGVNGWQSPI